MSSELSVQSITKALDDRILKKYQGYKRGVKYAYEELNELQEFRSSVLGEKLPLEMNLRPEGAYRMNH